MKMYVRTDSDWSHVLELFSLTERKLNVKLMSFNSNETIVSDVNVIVGELAFSEPHRNTLRYKTNQKVVTE